MSPLPSISIVFNTLNNVEFLNVSYHKSCFPALQTVRWSSFKPFLIFSQPYGSMNVEPVFFNIVVFPRMYIMFFLFFLLYIIHMNKGIFHFSPVLNILLWKLLNSYTAFCVVCHLWSIMCNLYFSGFCCITTISVGDWLLENDKKGHIKDPPNSVTRAWDKIKYLMLKGWV